MSTLIAKARNLLVELQLADGRKIVGKIIDFDEVFAEVIVMANPATGELAADRATFAKPLTGWREDRVLVNIASIIIIA